MYEELNGAGGKRSEDATMIDVETLLEGFLNLSPKICLTCSSIRVSRFSVSRLKEFYSIRYGSDNFGISISNIAPTRFYFVCSPDKRVQAMSHISCREILNIKLLASPTINYNLSSSLLCSDLQRIDCSQHFLSHGVLWDEALVEIST